MENSVCNLYLVDYDSLAQLVIREGYRRLLIQAPDGLKPLYSCITSFLTNEVGGFLEIYLSSSPTYGACDIAYDEALRTSSEAIIHVGHTRYPWLTRSSIPVHYIPAFYNWTPNAEDIDLIVKALHEIKAKNIGILASTQHVQSLSKLSEFLTNKGFETITPREEGFLDGQVIGCYYKHAERISNKIDAYLVVSGGLFHPLGLALIVDKYVFGYDPYRRTIWNATSYAKKILVKRLYLISRLKYSSIKEICIILGSKPGQFRIDLARRIGEEALMSGFKIHYVVSDKLDFDRMVAIDNALKSNIYVVTSCPRIPIDDLSDFYKPVLTPGEFYMLVHGVDRYVYPW
ncbi:MAG: diphthamide biosynthesis enzyme Dph2 [Desulfurococcaceae archaeon]